MTTAIYARYSSDLQSERSIEDQIAACKDYAKRIGLGEPYVVYSDAALSGASMATRPGLLKLIDDMGARRMHAVVSEAIDRLSRDQADVHLIRRASTVSGVKLYTIADGEVTSMVAGVKGIIEDDLWDAVQGRRRRVSPPPGEQPKSRPKRLLSGLLRCGVCGGGCSIVGPEIYGCSAVRQSGACTQRKTIPARKLDQRVLGGLKRILLSPDLVADAVKAFHEEQNARRARASRRRIELERDLAELTRRIDRLAEQLIETGAKALQPKLLAAEAEQAALEAQLAMEPAPEIVSLNPRAAEIYRARVADLETALSGPDADLNSREASRELISTIELLPDENERDGWRVTVHGDLGALLALANEKSPGGFAEGFFVRSQQPKLRKVASSVGLGAGVGFEPTTDPQFGGVNDHPLALRIEDAGATARGWILDEPASVEQ